MQKFDNILKKYSLNEAGESAITINPSQVEDATKKIANDPVLQKFASVMNAQVKGMDNDKVHKGLISVIDPKNPIDFSSAFTSESDRAAALEHLKKQGIPIAMANAQDNQEKPQQNNQEKTQEKNIQNSTQTSSTSYGGNLQGI